MDFDADFLRKYLDTDSFKKARLVCRFWASRIPLSKHVINPEHKLRDLYSLSSYRNITHLDLSGVNPLIAGKVDCSSFPNLSALSIPNDTVKFYKFIDLRILRIGMESGMENFYNRESNKIHGISYLTNLLSLEVGSSLMTNDYFGNLTKLTRLTYMNSMKRYFCSTKHLNSLTKLVELKEYEGLYDNKSLKYLTKLTNLSGCFLDMSEEDVKVAHLVNLTHLRVDKISSLELIKLTKLISLECKFIDVNEIDLSRLRQLDWLNAAHISRFSDNTLPNLTKLKYLSCCNIIIDNDNLAHLTNLTKLVIYGSPYLRENIHKAKVSYISDGLCSLTNLQTLRVDICKDTVITATGSVFSKLPKMREFTVSNGRRYSGSYKLPLSSKHNNQLLMQFVR
jgi:hypothetical protein